MIVLPKNQPCLLMQEKNNSRKQEPESLDGCSNIGPNPFAALIAQNNNANAATGRKIALNTNKFFDAFNSKINNEHIQQPENKKTDHGNQLAEIMNY